MTIADSRVVAHQWFRNGEATFTGWINGLPSERSLQAQRQCSETMGVTWTVEYAVPLSLLAEAESQLEADTKTIHEMVATIGALQSRLDAVVGLADELVAKYSQGDDEFTDPSDEAIVRTAHQLRSAALGGESPANDEELK